MMLRPIGEHLQSCHCGGYIILLVWPTFPYMGLGRKKKLIYISHNYSPILKRGVHNDNKLTTRLQTPVINSWVGISNNFVKRLVHQTRLK